MQLGPVSIAALQPSIDCPLAERVGRALALLDRAHEECSSGIFVLPEYYLAHLLPEPAATAALAEPVPGPSTQPFLHWAATRNSYVVIGLLEISSDPARPYNTAAVLGPDGVVGCYRKTHLWDLGPAKQAYRECQLFTAGARLGLLQIGGRRCGVMICADGVFAEVPRSLALQGAELILFANSRPAAQGEVEAAAAASYVPIAVSNPVGFNGVDYCLGSTRIVGPAGETLSAVGEGEVGWALSRLDLAAISETRANVCQVRLRRPELYGALGSVEVPPSR